MVDTIPKVSIDILQETIEYQIESKILVLLITNPNVMVILVSELHIIGAS